MRLIDVAIVHFDFSAGIKGPTVRAMAKFTFDELDNPQIAWIDLTQKESEIIVKIARMVEDRFLSGETPIPPETKRSIGYDTPASRARLQGEAGAKERAGSTSSSTTAGYNNHRPGSEPEATKPGSEETLVYGC